MCLTFAFDCATISTHAKVKVKSERKEPPTVYIVEWCDHTGQLNQRAFDTKEDAELEAAYLETKFDYVAILWETEI